MRAGWCSKNDKSKKFEWFGCGLIFVGLLSWLIEELIRITKIDK